VRLVVRSLVLLTFPVIAFGWLATARILPDPDDWAPVFTVDAASSAIFFLLTGAGLVVAGSTYLMLADFFRGSSTPRPVALPVVALAGLAGVGSATAPKRGISEPVLVPLVEKVRMDLVGNPRIPAWRY
jgi:hypothetical protein